MSALTTYKLPNITDIAQESGVKRILAKLVWDLYDQVWLEVSQNSIKLKVLGIPISFKLEKLSDAIEMLLVHMIGPRPSSINGIS